MPADLTDQIIDIRDAARVAHNVHETTCGEDPATVIAALVAELVTRLIGPMALEAPVFSKIVSDVAQCVQTITWTAGQRHN